MSLDMAMEQLIVYDARPSSKDNAFHEVVSFSSHREEGSSEGDIDDFGNTSFPRSNDGNEEGEHSAGASGPIMPHRPGPHRFRLHFISAPSGDSFISVVLDGIRLLIIPNAYYTLFDYFMRLYQLTFPESQPDFEPAAMPPNVDVNGIADGDGLGSAPVKVTTTTIFLSLSGLNIGFIEDIARPESRMLVFETDLLMKYQMRGASLTTERMIQLLLHNVKAYKVLATEKTMRKTSEREEDHEANVSFTLTKMLDREDLTSRFKEGMRWQKNVEGSSVDWKHRRRVPFLRPFRLSMHYDENEDRTVCTVSTGTDPLHFICSPSEDLNFLWVLLEGYGCNMIFNLWLPKMPDEEVLAGSDNDPAFHCAPYKIPYFPEGYKQAMEIHTEGVQLTLTEEDPTHMQLGR